MNSTVYCKAPSAWHCDTAASRDHLAQRDMRLGPAQGHPAWASNLGPVPSEHGNITVLLAGLSCALTEPWGGPALHARGDGDFGVVLSLTR